MDRLFINQLQEATDMIDLVLDNVATICYDKEVDKKIKPFSMLYTMDVLSLTFEQKEVKVDKR